MHWEAQKLSSKAQIALVLLATGARQSEAAAQAGITTKQLQRLTSTVLGRQFLDEQRRLYIQELRRVRVARQIQEDAAAMGLTGRRRKRSA